MRSWICTQDVAGNGVVLAIVRVSSVKLVNNLNSSFCFWSLLFIICLLSPPALIPQVKPGPRRSHQECPHAGIQFPKVLNACSPSRRQWVLWVVSPSPEHPSASSTLGTSSLRNYGAFVVNSGCRRKLSPRRRI